MNRTSLKAFREQAESLLQAKISNRAALIEAVPLLIEFEDSVKSIRKLLTECSKVIGRLSEACTDYAMDHQSVFDEGLKEVRDGVQAGDLTIDDTTFHFVPTLDKPKREDGHALTQTFLASLPVEWQKQKIELSANDATDEELAQHGLYRGLVGEWSVKE